MSFLPCFTFGLLVGLAASSPDYGFEEVPNTIPNDGNQPQPLSDIMHPPKGLRNSRQDRITIKAWPKGIIAYRIDQSFNGDTEMNNLIQAAMREIEDNTKRPDGSYCVRFIKKRPSDYDHIVIANINGCVSPLGNRGRGENIVTLGGPFCRSRTLIIHELMHTLGFIHEQNRPDRDNYVTVDWRNILRGQERNFKVYAQADVDTRSTRYDFGSIMHYTPYHWATDRSKPNLSMRDSRQLPEGVSLGGTVYMSKTDTKRVQEFYGCPVDTSHTKQEDPSARLVACNFERDICELIQDRNDDFDWTRVRGASTTRGTGPGGDHSAGSGYYLLGKAQGHYNKVARLKTRQYQYQDGGKYCLRGYINTYGRGGELTIIGRELASGIEHKDRRVSTPNGPYWNSIRSTLTMPSRWELELMYKAGQSSDSDIAIDDIHLSKGSCD